MFQWIDVERDGFANIWQLNWIIRLPDVGKEQGQAANVDAGGVAAG
jgi:hypothetical protein